MTIVNIAIALLLGSWLQPSTMAASSGCAGARFQANPAEHMMVESDTTLQVTEVRGSLKSEAGDWPRGAVVRFELVRRDGQPWRRTVRPDSAGRFHMRGVPAGRYCFRASAVGWQSIVGMLIVGDRSTAQSISLTLPLGV